MPEKYNNPLNFWQELKRRKVFRVIVMYAGAAYIIIELVNNVVEPLHLPDWTATLVILLLVIGFPIVAILSWVFDITPEGLKKTEPVEVAKEQETIIKPVKRKLKVSDLIILVLVVVIGILLYPKIFRSGKLEIVKDPDGRISITVLPFENLTGDSLYYDWQVGVQNLLINSLSNSKEISVRQPETMSNIFSGTGIKNYTSITPSIGSEIALKLETSTFILGNILKAGNRIRISAQLRDASNQEIYRSYKVDGDSEDQIFIMADSLSMLLMNFLEIKVLEKDAFLLAKMHAETYSAEAYRYYIQGREMASSSEYTEAIKLYHKALEKDSCFVSPLVWLIIAYANNGQLEQARLIQKRTAKYVDQAPLYEQLFYNYFTAYLNKDIQGRIKNARRLTKEFPYAITPYFGLGYSFNQIHQYEKASVAFDKRIELMRQMDFNEKWIPLYREAGRCYHELGQHIKEQEVYELGLSALPDHPIIISRQAICAFSQDNPVEGDKYLDKYRSIREEQGWEEYKILNDIGVIYRDAGLFNEAEKCFKQIIENNPQYVVGYTNLAHLYLVNEIHVDEAMELLNHAYTIAPNSYSIMYLEGMGLFKQSNFEKALELLNTSWDLRAEYNHEHFLLLQEVEQALARQESRRP